MRAFLSTPGFEPALVAELARAGHHARVVVPGIVTTGEPGEDGEDGEPGAAPGAHDPVFARQVLPRAALVTGGSVRALAEASFAVVEAAIDRWPGPFSLHALAPTEAESGLASRAALVGRELLALLRERRRRAWRRYLAPEPAPPPSATDRMLVQLLALDRVRWLVSAAGPRLLAGGGVDLSPWPAGDAPVARDRGPPSRAYQKLEEAFAWMGAAPEPGAPCVDLGASPGGWTATLLKRGARVTAVDRAPLAPPLARDPRVTMVVGNAFTYRPAARVAWMVSDVVCEPPRSLALIETWLERDLCRSLVVTVKFKGRAGYGILDDLPARLARFEPGFTRIKQLGHNKNEVTVMFGRRSAKRG